MRASAHWCIIFEAEMPFVQSSINQSDKSLKIALQSKRKPNDPCRETLKQKEIQNNKETYIQIWIEIEVEIEWQPDFFFICILVGMCSLGSQCGTKKTPSTMNN